MEDKELWISAVADGQLYPMSEIPDPVFSSGTLGKCVGILPSENGTVYAPCDGKVTSVAQTKHAMTFTDKEGSQYLVHVGIDTVKMNGDGFKILKEEGTEVKAGEPVLEADLDKIRKAGYSAMIIVAKAD